MGTGVEEYLDIDSAHAAEVISTCISGPQRSLSYNFMGWQDGDYFTELCQEDGGTIAEHVERFAQMFRNVRVPDQEHLMEAVRAYQALPFLSSVRGNYKYHYDMWIWSRRFHMEYNSRLKRMNVWKRNLFDMVFAFSHPTLPDWREGG
jgi:hypothetical protein